AFVPSQNFDSSANKIILDSLTARLESLDTNRQQDNNYRNPVDAELETIEVQLFAFDPNEVSIEEWQRLGMKKYLANRIIKYRSKGGKFRKKEDLKKIYGFPENLYTSLEPYIQIPDNQGFKKKEFVPREEKEKPRFEKKEFNQVTTFDLNTADTTQLKRIKGIGTGFANRIIKYRENLGGFYEANQIREIYGLPPETADELLKYATIQTPAIKIDLNTVSQEELGRHPYFRRFAKVIIAYRKQHGDYASSEDLKKIKIISAEDFEKMKLYLP
ncbi:MAG: helix-hairpin-helix domain-containing protein, partial [Verrucomicrobia bacterium]|nr:helix-hairpin-helix domain-containing protein [Cytophagales bacterium]